VVELIQQEINSHHRSYYIDEVNWPLMKAIGLWANRYPEPTKENTLHPNCHRLLDWRDEFLRHSTNPRLRKVVTDMVRIGIAKYSHSPPYRDTIDFFVECLYRDGWKRMLPSRQINYWNK